MPVCFPTAIAYGESERPHNFALESSGTAAPSADATRMMKTAAMCSGCPYTIDVSTAHGSTAAAAAAASHDASASSTAVQLSILQGGYVGGSEEAIQGVIHDGPRASTRNPRATSTWCDSRLAYLCYWTCAMEKLVVRSDVCSRAGGRRERLFLLPHASCQAKACGVPR